jgi:hypothetical protein
MISRPHYYTSATIDIELKTQENLGQMESKLQEINKAMTEQSIQLKMKENKANILGKLKQAGFGAPLQRSALLRDRKQCVERELVLMKELCQYKEKQIQGLQFKIEGCLIELNEVWKLNFQALFSTVMSCLVNTFKRLSQHNDAILLIEDKAQQQMTSSAKALKGFTKYLVYSNPEMTTIIKDKVRGLGQERKHARVVLKDNFTKLIARAVAIHRYQIEKSMKTLKSMLIEKYTGELDRIATEIVSIPPIAIDISFVNPTVKFDDNEHELSTFTTNRSADSTATTAATTTTATTNVKRRRRPSKQLTSNSTYTDNNTEYEYFELSNPRESSESSEQHPRTFNNNSSRIYPQHYTTTSPTTDDFIATTTPIGRPPVMFDRTNNIPNNNNNNNRHRRKRRQQSSF